MRGFSSGNNATQTGNASPTLTLQNQRCGKVQGKKKKWIDGVKRYDHVSKQLFYNISLFLHLLKKLFLKIIHDLIFCTGTVLYKDHHVTTILDITRNVCMCVGQDDFPQTNKSIFDFLAISQDVLTRDMDCKL